VSDSLAPQPQLRSRPDTRALSLDDLVEHTRKGRIRVPDFQRALKWEADDALKLLDSIDRGYPVGTLLFWQRESEAGVVRLGPRELQAPAQSDAWFVIDGQQRITALMRTLDAAADDPWRAAYDLDAHAFVGLRRGKANARRVPVDVVFDQARLLSWLTKDGAQTPEAQRHELFDLTRRLQKYTMPAVIVTASPDEEAAIRDIFTRLNESGKRLDVNDAFRAFHEQKRDDKRDLDVVAQAIEALGFGTFDRDLLVTLLAVTRGIDPGKVREAIQERDFIDDTALPTLERAVAALVQFLRTDCGIPHRALVPYDLVFEPLVRFFQAFPTAHPRTRELLKRYVWRGFIHQQFRRDYANVRLHVGAIAEAKDEHDAAQRLLRLVHADAKEPVPAKKFSMGAASVQMDVLALLSAQPVDLADGTPLVAQDRFFDRALLPPVLVAPELAEHGIYGRLFHRDAASAREAIVHCRDHAALASHALSEAARAALGAGDLAQFVSVRRQLVDTLRTAFFARMAVWSPADGDRPPLHAVRAKAARAAGSGP
jgi:Protein of unknown function DUF262